MANKQMKKCHQRKAYQNYTLMSYNYVSIRIAIIKLLLSKRQMIRVSEDMEKLKYSYTVSGRVKWCSHIAKLTIPNFTPWFILKSNKYYVHKKYLHTNFHSNFIHNSQIIETTQMYINEGMNK